VVVTTPVYASALGAARWTGVGPNGRWAGKENNQRVRFLADEEETRLREAIGEDPWPLVAVAIHTGLRQGEQFHLRWEHVDFATGILTVPRSKHGGARRVPMNDTVRGRPSGPGPCRAV
jgi:integrase